MATTIRTKTRERRGSPQASSSHPFRTDCLWLLGRRLSRTAEAFEKSVSTGIERSNRNDQRQGDNR